MRFLAIVLQYRIFRDKNNIQLNISTSHCLNIKQIYMQAWLEFTETIKFQNLGRGGRTERWQTNGAEGGVEDWLDVRIASALH